MLPDNTIYYTDGHQVMITNDGMKVKGSFYRLSSITHHEQVFVRPQRLPSLTLTIMGIAFFFSGTLNFIPESWNTNVNLLGFQLLVNSVMMGVGILFLCAGIVLLIVQKEKYAVQITTAEGTMNVVISHSREYIKEVVYGLNRAYLDQRHKPDEVKKQFQVLG